MILPCKSMKVGSVNSCKSQLNLTTYTCQDAQHPGGFGLSISR